MGFVDPYLLLTLLFATTVALAWVTKRVGLSYVAGYVVAGVLLSPLASNVREGCATLLDVFSGIAIALLALEVRREVGLENIKRLGMIFLRDSAGRGLGLLYTHGRCHRDGYALDGRDCSKASLTC